MSSKVNRWIWRRLARPAAPLAAALAAAALAAAQAPPQARIKIDTERVIGEVDPHLFGNFAEHLGRCVYGGIYDEGSPLAGADGFRKDVIDAAKGLNVSLLRWPGGNFVSGYHWEDGIGPKEKRPVRRDDAWGALESNRFGTDEFLRYCERVGAEPYVCINAGLGTIDEARHWVEYCNEPDHTYYADLRRANGRDKPWNVKIWGLGNEIDGPWQLGHRNAEDYAKFALEAAKAMRRADDSIKLIASGSSNFSPGYDWIGWNRTVLDYLKNDIDYLSLHTYIGNRDNNFEKFLAAGADIDRRIAIVDGLIKAAREGQNPAARRPIYIAFDEWNVWYRTCCSSNEFVTGRMGLEERYNTEDALAMGMFLNSFIRRADVVKVANLAQLVNVIAPIVTNQDGLFLQTIYWPLVEYGRQRGNQSLDALVTAPSYDYDGRQVSYLDVSATWDEKGHRAFINVLNRSSKLDIAARIDSVGGRASGEIAVWELNHPDLKAVNSFEDDKKVRPTTRTIAVTPTGNGFVYKFPAHSLTILTLKLE
ncbi:MAG: alpha-L-arabinofuranosidase C-terminal domain-containing protein [Bryobacteraceae bacterium]